MDALGPDVFELDFAVEADRIAARLREITARVLHKRGLVVAISGGVDSSVCAALAVRALGPGKVFTLILPERDSASSSAHNARLLAGHLGVRTETADIAPALAAIGCYAARDEAVRRVLPDYTDAWRMKIAIAGGSEGAINHFKLIAESPDGARHERTLPLAEYLQIVAATNYKQRLRKTLEYFHADRLNYAVVGTPNRLEYDQGFFVKNGDGSADVKPIAHLYKTQVYGMARYLGLPECVATATPTTDTYSLAQGQDEFYFALPWAQMDLALWALEHRHPASELADALGISEIAAEAVYDDIQRKRRSTRYLHLAPLLLGSEASDMMAGNDSAYTCELGLAGLPRDREQILSIWRDNLGDPARHAGKFDWFYLGNPFGQPLLQLLRHRDEAIGCCGAGPRRMLWQGREIRAGLLADMAVDVRHRTLGPALMLQEALMASASGRFDLLYGFPNRKSLPVVRRLGYAVLGELSRHARVLRHAGYLQRRLPSWLAGPVGSVLDAGRALLDGLRALSRRHVSVAWSERADPRMDALWQASPRGEGLVGLHDAAMTGWRFDQSPLARTRYLLVSDRRSGALRAWFACQGKEHVLHVRDFWSEHGVEGIDPRLVLALVRVARREGCASITLECAAPPERMAGWRRAGFVLREGQPVVGKWLGEGPAPADLASGWHLTEADADE